MPVRNTNLYICYGIPWPRDYSHVRLFSNVGEQIAYIQSKAKFPVQGNLAYIRDDAGIGIRISIAADELKDCNYIAFQNLNYEGDWHYAFIDRVSYINDGLSIIYFTLDWFQTYCFNMEIQPGFVEREHVSDDTVGANLLDEPVMHSPAICDESVMSSSDYTWYVYATEELEVSGIEWTNPGVINHSGYYIAVLGENLFPAAYDLVNQYSLAGKLEAIVCFFAHPVIDSPGTVTAPNPGTLDGYTPRNNKLLTYPYQFIEVVAPGSSQVYRYEWFNGVPRFVADSIIAPGANVAVEPVDYQDSERQGQQYFSPEYSVTISGIPTASVLANGFINELSNKPLQTAMSLEAPIANMLGGAALGTAALAVPGVGPAIAGGIATSTLVSGMQSLTNAVGDLYSKSLTAHTTAGSASVGDVYEYNSLRFKIKHMCVNEEMAKVIDSFFDMMGYRVCQVKAPNTTGRASWNYVQMRNAIVTGNAPADAIQSYINRINTGITFWHTNDVGNYSLSNTIVGG